MESRLGGNKACLLLTKGVLILQPEFGDPNEFRKAALSLEKRLLDVLLHHVALVDVI